MSTSTDPGEMAGEINELNAEIKRLNGALRELAIASSESLAEARSGLKASQEALAEAPVLWTCPDCAFSYDTRHALPDGTFNCPVCGEARLEVALAEALEMHRLRMEKAKALADALRTYHRANRMHNDLEADLYDLSKAALAEWEGK